ncbi:ABC transporter ATP-binding protein [Sphingobacterium kyonggiense]
MIAQLKWSLSFNKRYWKGLCLYILLELISLCFGLLFIWTTKQAIDQAFSNEPQELLYPKIFQVGMYMTFSFLSGLFSGWINERYKSKMLMDLQNSMLDSQMSAKWADSLNWHSGELLIRTINDCQETVNVLSTLWVNILMSGIRITAGFSLLFWLDPILAMVILMIVPLFLVSKSYFKKMRNLNLAVKEEEGRFGTIIQENLGNRLFLRSIGWYKQRRDLVSEVQRSILEKKQTLLNFSTFSKGSMGIVLQTGYFLTFIWGTLKLQSAEISFGTMTAFLQLVGRIQGPAVALMTQMPAFIRFRNAVDRVIETLSVPKEEIIYSTSVDQFDSLMLKNVTFGYENKNLLKAVNLEAHRGIPTALMGESGRGKSTLLRIIMGLYPVASGKLVLRKENQEIEISEVSRNYISFVPQGPKLLSGSILYNIVGDLGRFSESEVEWALTQACAEFVYALPRGLETIVGESGIGLSEGQAQRIGIARAILQNRPIWLFDEVTSALDEDKSERLINNLIRIGKNKIIIFVTHNRSLSGLFKNLKELE